MASELTLETIRGKLVGKKVTQEGIFSLISDLVNDQLSDIFLAYFLGAGFAHGFSDEELYYIVEAMVKTGQKLKFSGIVADKHSTGGVAGTRTTMILVPIVAACGFKVPKNSSRAITSPAGTADVMEVLAPVTFNADKIKKIVEKTGGCIVWGGSLNIAPADEKMIKVERPLSFESYDNIVFSIMAKKIASGATHLILDIPVGPTMKIQHFEDAQKVTKKFNYLAGKFKLKLAIDVNYTAEPAGNGAGPVLEVRDVLSILERRKDRPQSLEKKAVRLSGRLLDLCLAKGEKVRGDIKKRYKELDESGEKLALSVLDDGQALVKMREIVKAQGGDQEFSFDSLKVGSQKYEVKSGKAGEVVRIDNKALTTICRVLGCPEDKKAGVYLVKKIGDKLTKTDVLFQMYSSDRWRLQEATEELNDIALYKID